MNAQTRTLIFRILVQNHHVEYECAVPFFPPDPALEKVDTPILRKQSYCPQVEQEVQEFLREHPYTVNVRRERLL